MPPRHVLRCAASEGHWPLVAAGGPLVSIAGILGYPNFQAKSRKNKANTASTMGGSLHYSNSTTLAGTKANMVS